MYAAVSAVSDGSCNKPLCAACLFYYIALAPWNSHKGEGGGGRHWTVRTGTHMVWINVQHFLILIGSCIIDFCPT